MTQESLQPFLNWISAHPHWSGFIVCLISLSESLAIVGLVVPGVVLMTAIGSMMGAGILPFWTTLLWAILGAIAGDGISYWLGYHYHEKLRNYWPFKQFPTLLARGEKFFQAHGGKSIIFGRFVGPVRPMIPVIAGMMDMTPKRFLVFNILSAIVWAPLYSLPGILIGVSLGRLPPEAASRVGFLILAFLLFLWLLYEFFITIGKGTTRLIQKTLNKIWKAWQVSPRLTFLHKVLYTAQGTEEGQLGIAFLFIFACICFGTIFCNVMNSDGISLWNEPVYQALRALYSDRAIHFLAIFTALGDPHVLIPTSFAIGLWFLWRKRYITSLCWFGTIAIGFVSGLLIKNYVEMPRPEGLFHLAEGYSFPSNHALLSTITYGLAAALIHQSLSPNYRKIPWLIIIPIILLIGFSRLYLGAHWFTDVLGGIMLGIAFVTLSIFLYRRFEPKHTPIRGILIPGLSLILIMMIYFMVTVYPKQKMEFTREWTTTTVSRANWWSGNSPLLGLYRSGAIKRQATIFDIQWLGSLPTIKDTLQKEGFKEISKLNFNNSFLILANHPASNLFPIMPKFHRDRLPVLTMAKEIDPSNRLVLQLWHSDFLTENKTPIWVGTLRLEEAKHPFPMVTVFLEKPSDGNISNLFWKGLSPHPKRKTRETITQTPQLHHILLIDSSQEK